MWCSLNWCKWCPLNSCMWCTLNRCMWCTFISVCGACLCLYDYVSWYGLTDEEIDPILGRENTRYNPPTPLPPPLLSSFPLPLSHTEIPLMPTFITQKIRHSPPPKKKGRYPFHIAWDEKVIFLMRKACHFDAMTIREKMILLYRDA